MNIKSIFMAVIGFAFAASCHASVVTFNTNAQGNSTAGDSVSGASANGGALILKAGETFSINTDPSQLWYAAVKEDPNYWMFNSNADGNPNAWTFDLPGLASVHIGSLVADINGIYQYIGAGTHNFTAWASGELQLHFADINNYDNSGTIVSSVTTNAPEPTAFALLFGGLFALGFARKRKQSM